MAPKDYTTGLTQARLKSLLHYEPETGVFTRVAQKSNRGIGAQAGFIHSKSGYRCIKVDGRRYYASRLAWLYMTGDWPADLVDHKDADRANDAWANLRAASFAQNMQNKAAAKTKRHPLKGVYFRTDAARTKPWQAAIRINGALKFLGNFTKAEEANAAYLRAAEVHFGAFARA